MASIDREMTAEQIEAKAFYSRSTVSYCACEPTDEIIHSLGGCLLLMEKFEPGREGIILRSPQLVQFFKNVFYRAF